MEFSGFYGVYIIQYRNITYTLRWVDTDGVKSRMATFTASGMTNDIFFFIKFSRVTCNSVESSQRPFSLSLRYLTIIYTATKWEADVMWQVLGR